MSTQIWYDHGTRWQAWPQRCAIQLCRAPSFTRSAVLRLQRSDHVNMLFLASRWYLRVYIAWLSWLTQFSNIGYRSCSILQLQSGRQQNKRHRNNGLAFWRLWIHTNCILESWGCHQMHVLGGQCASLTNCEWTLNKSTQIMAAVGHRLPISQCSAYVFWTKDVDKTE